jgi:transposase
MTTPEDMASLSREELLALVAELQCQVAVLQKQVTELSTRNQALAAENDQLKRSAKGRATPFSKGTRTREPRRPGRQPGEGTFSFRQAPRPEEITEPPVKVPMTLECCPRCGGKLAEERVDLACN